MDADYLNKNVRPALVEALASTAISMPEDKIEFLGKYLLQYAERNARKLQNEDEMREVDEKLQTFNEALLQKAMTLEKQRADIDDREKALVRFLDSLQIDSKEKNDSISSALAFLVEYLDITAAYIAKKEVVGESEMLRYIAASPGQEFIVGKKMMKPEAVDGDAPFRQGVSFEAFKIPDPVEENAETDENGEPVESKPKEDPKPLPIVIENVMRDTRVKFFGIPKLGSYAAFTFSYLSIDHEKGVQLRAPAVSVDGSGEAVPSDETEEGGEATEPADTRPEVTNPLDESSRTPADAFEMEKVKTEFILGFDIMGVKYRVIKHAEIEVAEKIALALTAALENAEKSLFEKHVTFLLANDAMIAVATELTASIQAEEDAALQAVQISLSGDGAAPPTGEDGAAETAAIEEVNAEPKEEPHEAFKPYKDADAVVAVWNKTLSDPKFGDLLSSIATHVLPLPQQCNNLFYAVGVLAGLKAELFQDATMEAAWPVIRTTGIPILQEKMTSFKPSLIRTLPKYASIESIRAFVDSNNLLDAASYPANFPVFKMMSSWLQKALVSREAAILYFKAAKNKVIETIE